MPRYPKPPGPSHRDPRRIRHAVQSHYAPGAVFLHSFARAAGRPAIYKVYRAYAAAFISRPVVREVAIDPRWAHEQLLQPAGCFAAGLVSDALDLLDGAWDRLRGGAAAWLTSAGRGKGRAAATAGAAAAALKSSFDGGAAVSGGGGGGGTEGAGGPEAGWSPGRYGSGNGGGGGYGGGRVSYTPSTSASGGSPVSARSSPGGKGP